MKLILENAYKSLEPFESDELSDFAIITGKNGSGKSQLLNLISLRANKSSEVQAIKIFFRPYISKVQFQGIEKDNVGIVNYTSWKSVIDSHLKSFQFWGENIKKVLSYFFEKGREIVLDEKAEDFNFEDETYKDLLLSAIKELYGPRGSHSVSKIDLRTEQQLLSHFVHNGALVKILKEIYHLSEKLPHQLVNADFYSHSFSELAIDNKDLFSSQLELLFYNYAKRRYTNRLDNFYKETDGEENKSVTDDQFTKLFKPPWETLNEILADHKIDFNFKIIDNKSFNPHNDLDFQLIKKSSGQSVDFNDLSSGEKIIIGLVIKLFITKYYNTELGYPGLIVLDEPDAFLHPEMTGLLIAVLEQTFVRQFGMKVLITTHSPTTVALAPEDSIFQLTNHANSSLTKISKDAALEMLTSSIPTLSIDYKNHRQIFVESPTDVNYYQALYDKHNSKVKLTHKLYFISNGYGKGNCVQVYDIVLALRQSGNNTCYGIVDWDLCNSDHENIYVHGLQERYSVENYIFDPIFIIILLVQMRYGTIIKNAQIDISENEYLWGEKSNNQIQLKVDAFFSEIHTRFPILKETGSIFPIYYLSGQKIYFPEWYCKTKGHEIEDKLKKVFPPLISLKNEGELQKKLTAIMVKCYPFVPLTTINLVEKIAGKS